MIAIGALLMVSFAVASPPAARAATPVGPSVVQSARDQPTPPPQFNCIGFGSALAVISPEPAAGLVGTVVELEGSGYYNRTSGPMGSFTIWMANYTGGSLLYLTFVPAGAPVDFFVNVTVPSGNGTVAFPPGPYEFWSLENYTETPTCANAPFTLTGAPPPSLGCVSWSAGLTVLSPSPPQGPAGSNVTLQGRGFSYEGDTSVVWANTTGSPDSTVGSVRASDPDGWFNVSVEVPTGYPPGTYVFWAIDGNADCAGAEFVLTATHAATLTLNPTAGAPGITVSANGSGLATDATVTFTFDGASVSSTCATNGTGVFPGTTGTPCTFTVPSAPYGDDGGRNVVATAAPSSTAYASFTVLPGITLSPDEGPMGGTFTVTGTAFSPSPDTADLTFDGSLISPSQNNSECDIETALITLNSTGGFVCTFTVPSWATFGANGVQGYDTSSTELTTVQTFTVLPELSITSTPTVGYAGTPVTATGAGWTPGDSIALWVAVVSDTSAITTVDCAGAPSGEPTVGTTGAFVCNFDFPVDGPGVFYVVATDATHVTFPATVIYSTNTFQLEVPLIDLLPAEGPVGTVVTVAGSLFPSGGLFYYCFEGSGPPTACGTSRAFVATGTGDIPSGTAILVPSSGNAQLVVSDTATGVIGYLPFTVTMPFTVTVSPSNGQAGSTSISVGGLSDSMSYYVYLDTVQGVASSATYDPLGTCMSSSAGAITDCTVNIPSGLGPGKYYLDLFQDPSPPPFIYSVYNFTLTSHPSTGVPSSVLGLPILEFAVLVLVAVVVVILAVVAANRRRRRAPPPAEATRAGTPPKGPTPPP